MTAEDLMATQRLVRRLPVGESVVEAILDLVRPRVRAKAIRDHPAYRLGPGPRAAQALMLATRARALVDGRLSPSLDDVVALAEPVLKHRMALTFAARAEGETIAGDRRRNLPGRPGMTDGRPAARYELNRAGRRATEAGALELARRFPGLSSPRRKSRRASCTACTAAAAQAPARHSGSSAPSSRARRRTGSIGAARRVTTASMCASANGRRRTRSGSGWTVRPPWASSRARAAAEDRPRAGARSRRRRSSGARRRTRRPARPHARLRRRATSSSASPKFCSRRKARAGYEPAELPPRCACRRAPQAMLIGDFLSDPDADRSAIEALCRARRARPSRDDRRSGRGDLSFHRPYRIPRRRFAGAAARRPGGELSAAIISRRLAAHREAIARSRARARLDA